jgi:hypothetical protein
LNTYEISTGRWLNDAGEVLGVGYSGKGELKNNPSAQNVHNLGPIPCGLWRIGKPHKHPKHGPFLQCRSLRCSDQDFGRSGFGCHGDSIQHPGEASEGCIIMPPDARHRIWASGDDSLHVVKGTSNQTGEVNP